MPDYVKVATIFLYNLTCVKKKKQESVQQMKTMSILYTVLHVCTTCNVLCKCSMFQRYNARTMYVML